MAQHGRRDIDERRRHASHTRREAATFDHQKRPLLVGAEPAMLAEPDLRFAIGRIEAADPGATPEVRIAVPADWPAARRRV